ncbi:hypothetical protein [uncultured Parasphingorhabdus sp.]|uniref:hypothetical protein n=1 Tax=uncultured Parasphingorhabdus sp. TaxID=2709694 RepID=UPI0030DA9A0C
MNAWLTCSKWFIASAAAALSAGAGSASEPAAIDWETATAGFAEGEQRSPMVFNMKDAARCSGRWMVHAGAIHYGTFPETVVDAFIEQLRLPAAVLAVDFFVTEDRDHPASRDAPDEADRLLGLALAGDAAAARTYFDNLGLCSTRPEMVQDLTSVAIDAAATTQEQAEESPIEIASSDFDEPVNQRRLAFIELFVQRLRDGAPVADLLKPQITYVYMVKHDCAAATTGYVELLPASDVDTGFPFEAAYTWENPDCMVPPELDSIEAFNLKETMSHWDRIEAAANDHNFDVFFLSDRARNDYLLISVEPYGKGYAVSKIEYRLEMP